MVAPVAVILDEVVDTNHHCYYQLVGEIAQDATSNDPYFGSVNIGMDSFNIFLDQNSFVVCTLLLKHSQHQISHDQDTLHAETGCAEMHVFHMAALIFLTCYGISHMTHRNEGHCLLGNGTISNIDILHLFHKRSLDKPPPSESQLF